MDQDKVRAIMTETFCTATEAATALRKSGGNVKIAIAKVNATTPAKDAVCRGCGAPLPKSAQYCAACQRKGVGDVQPVGDASPTKSAEVQKLENTLKQLDAQVEALEDDRSPTADRKAQRLVQQGNTIERKLNDLGWQWEPDRGNAFFVGVGKARATDAEKLLPWQQTAYTHFVRQGYSGAQAMKMAVGEPARKQFEEKDVLPVTDDFEEEGFEPMESNGGKGRAAWEDVKPVGARDSEPHPFAKPNGPSTLCNQCLEPRSHPNHVRVGRDAYPVVKETNTPGFKLPPPPANMPKNANPERMKEWMRTGKDGEPARHALEEPYFNNPDEPVLPVEPVSARDERRGLPYDHPKIIAIRKKIYALEKQRVPYDDPRIEKLTEEIRKLEGNARDAQEVKPVPVNNAKAFPIPKTVPRSTRPAEDETFAKGSSPREKAGLTQQEWNALTAEKRKALIGSAKDAYTPQGGWPARVKQIKQMLANGVKGAELRALQEELLEAEKQVRAGDLLPV